jgi:hypothetical protein
MIVALLISLLEKNGWRYTGPGGNHLPKPTRLVWRVWICLVLVMIVLYIFFNGF